MDEHQRIDAALGDEPRGNDGLSESRRCRQHAGVMGQHLACGGLLLGSQFAMKCHIQWFSRESFIANADLDAQVGEQRLHFLQTPARQTDMIRVILGAGNDSRLAVRRQTHCLRLVELWILKCGKPEQSIAQSRRQSCPFRYRSGRRESVQGSSATDRQWWARFRRRDGDAFQGSSSSSSVASHPNTDNSSSLACITNDLLDGRLGNPLDRDRNAH